MFRWKTQNPLNLLCLVFVVKTLYLQSACVSLSVYKHKCPSLLLLIGIYTVRDTQSNSMYTTTGCYIHLRGCFFYFSALNWVVSVLLSSHDKNDDVEYRKANTNWNIPTYNYIKNICSFFHSWLFPFFRFFSDFSLLVVLLFFLIICDCRGRPASVVYNCVVPADVAATRPHHI